MQTLSSYLNIQVSRERPTVAKRVNTCAINIDEPTSRSALGVNSKEQFYPPKYKEKIYLQNKLSVIRIIIIDDIFMISRKIFLLMCHYYWCSISRLILLLPVVICIIYFHLIHQVFVLGKRRYPYYERC